MQTKITQPDSLWSLQLALISYFYVLAAKNRRLSIPSTQLPCTIEMRHNAKAYHAQQEPAYGFVIKRTLSRRGPGPGGGL